MFTKHRILSLFALAVLFLQANLAYTQTVDNVQLLSFGSFILLNNKASHAVTVTPLGVTSYSAAIISNVDAVNGIYTISGFPADTDVFVSFSPPSLPLACACGGPVVTVDNFTIDPALPRTNISGDATIKIGARLSTDGTNALYNPGNYSGQLTLIVNF